MSNPNQVLTYYLITYHYYEKGVFTKAGYQQVALNQRMKPYSTKKIMASIADHLGVDADTLLPINIQELGSYPRAMIEDLKEQAEALTVTI
ncbi:hypothetical protein LAZ44_17235 [Vibrio alginolyticus]|uniref:hypothetical protein n=1 Tax=Vibrio TaxID=662 RepID=UPI001CDD3E12|nr:MULTISPECIES: hypothetical protein [Vibrio]MDF5517876.1 hypothetical protein [Vibrio parahaemolyticus]MCA2451647.1 hypothetical protein [Vibrio alginolyticus]MCA2475464.1 hypothetical protein [Vibrio alginolyticus]MDW2155492.1 hypothetical protein [Vibrio sp. 2092]MDW2231650.1 hypothetical protein [Vibrio sp. 2091]